MTRLVIIGGGVAGLATAFQVRRRIDADELPGWTPDDVTVLDAAPRLGGFCVTESVDGYLLDWGPNGFLDNEPATLRMVDELGLRDRLRRASDAAASRFLFIDGRLRSIPTRPGPFLRSGLLSWRGLLRLAIEPFVPPRRDGRDESVASFARRRVGPEFVTNLLDPMISGVYAGDVERLSLHGALPKMAALEREHGSLVRGMIARKRAGGGAGPAGPGGVLHTFAGGIGELTDRLAAACGARLRPGCRVTAVRPDPAGGWRVEFAEGEVAPVGTRDTTPGRAPLPAATGALTAAQVVLACPAREAAQILAAWDPALAAPLREVKPAPIAVVSLGYDISAFARPVDGFGFLIPRKEKVRSLGVLWTSSFFPFQAPPGKVLLRVMIGGARDPGVAGLPDAAVQENALADLARTMAPRTAPELVRLFRYREGIPQYAVGHRQRLADVTQRLAARPGLHLTGNSLYGISVNHCAKEAYAVVDAVVAAAAVRPV
jgi:oxygen-dependent protoporphyrinogen oxidase